MDTDEYPRLVLTTPHEGSPVVTHESRDSGSEEETLPKNELTCGYRCGSKGHVPCHCLQPLGTAKCALVLISLGNMIQQLLINGVFAVTISTLEKR